MFAIIAASSFLLGHEPLARHAGHDQRLGLVAGAAAAMVIMAAEFGADARLVAFITIPASPALRASPP